jgi:hypothetical protein
MKITPLLNIQIVIKYIYCKIFNYKNMKKMKKILTRELDDENLEFKET